MSKIFRFTFQAVFDVEADTEDEAYAKLPESFDWDNGYIIDCEEVE